MQSIKIHLDFRKYNSHPALIKDLSPAFSCGLGDEVYAVPGNPTVVRCQIRDIEMNKYFPRR